jgi:negative regulator of genetic competence, sporulation and motility
MKFSGNVMLDFERQLREDPMSSFVAKKHQERELKYARVEKLKAIMEEIREEEKQKDSKKNKKHHKSKHKSKHKDL